MNTGTLEPESSAPSITARLLRGLMGPVALVAILLGISGVWAVSEAVEAVNDRILAASARAIVEAVAVEQQTVVLEIPPSAFAMLENSSRDNIYYNVIHSGRVISGYADLPVVAPSIANGETRFGKSSFRGQEIRMVAEARRLPQADGLIVVQVAETVRARQRLLRPVLLALASIEGVLVILGIVLVPLTVRWGLRPLAKLRSEIDGRKPSDSRPLPLTDVPFELVDLVRAFNDMLRRREEAVQRMRRFTADASHQMRTPLSILRAHIAVLEGRRSQAGQVQQSIKDISDASSRLQQLLTQLLALARAEDSGASPALPEDVDLTAIVRNVVAEMAPQAFASGIELDLSIGNKPVKVRGNAALSAELLANLLDNAIKYNRKNGWVYVCLEPRAKATTVVIEDEGPGIEADERSRAFERFVRLHDEHETVGSGLGLAIANALAETIGAHIVLTDREGAGGLRVEVHFQTSATDTRDRSMSASPA